jgi:hypothetical protein
MKTRFLSVLLLAVALTSAYLAIEPFANLATGAKTFPAKLKAYTIEDNRFSNYDFGEEKFDSENVDWAVDLIFAHGGTVNIVKDKLDDVFWFGRRKIPVLGTDYGTTPMHARVNGGFGGEWDEDAGRKTAPCQTDDEPNAFHYRIYGPHRPIDHFFNQKWDAFVVATSHIDHNECPGPIFPEGDGKWYGHSELSEFRVAIESASAFPRSRIFLDQVHLNNNEGYREEGNHLWENNGLATFIAIHP